MFDGGLVEDESESGFSSEFDLSGRVEPLVDGPRDGGEAEVGVVRDQEERWVGGEGRGSGWELNGSGSGSGFGGRRGGGSHFGRREVSEREEVDFRLRRY